MMYRLTEGLSARRTRLHFAIESTTGDEVLRLLELGADVRAKDWDGNTPLHLAAQGGNIKVVEILLQHGADLINAKNNQGQTPLHKAVIKTRIEVVKLLLQKEPDLTVTENDGMSVLHSALTWRTLNAIQKKRNLETIKILLEHDANLPKAEDNKGNTPLHFAIMFENPEALKLLLNAKADPKAADNKGNTPLHFAAALGHIDMVELLLEKGADPTIKNHDGKTAYTLTEGSYNLEEQAQYNPILSLLENALQKTDNSRPNRHWLKR